MARAAAALDDTTPFAMDPRTNDDALAAGRTPIGVVVVAVVPVAETKASMSAVMSTVVPATTAVASPATTAVVSPAAAAMMTSATTAMAAATTAVASPATTAMAAAATREVRRCGSRSRRRSNTSAERQNRGDSNGQFAKHCSLQSTGPKGTALAKN